MKKKIYLLAVAILLASAPTMVSAKDTRPKEIPLTEQQKIRVREITRRVEEIKSMDRSTLTRDQRKDLRNELKSLKKEADILGRGVYLSVGAIIIIILLLILIF